MTDRKLLTVVKDSLSIGLLWSVCFCFDSVTEDIVTKSEGFGAFGGLKYNLLEETDISCLLKLQFG